MITVLVLVLVLRVIVSILVSCLMITVLVLVNGALVCRLAVFHSFYHSVKNQNCTKDFGRVVAVAGDV